MSKVNKFRVGKVRACLRGRVWYLCYHENGRRRRPRVGTDREAARQLAAQVNAQLEVGAPRRSVAGSCAPRRPTPAASPARTVGTRCMMSWAARRLLLWIS
jgi:hypothetical protein